MLRLCVRTDADQLFYCDVVGLSQTDLVYGHQIAEAGAQFRSFRSSIFDDYV